MKVTLFGASGFIGSHVAEQLTLAGHQVRCLVRSSSDCHFLQTLPVQISTCQFSNDLHTLIDSDSIVINCIADTRQHLSDQERRKTEVTLAKRLFQAAETRQCRQFIQLSTVMVYGFDRPAQPIDEHYPPSPHYSYNRIALEREQALQQLAGVSKIPLTLLRPANTTGQRDAAMLPSFIQSMRFGLFPVIGNGNWRFSCIDTRDIGRAMAVLIEHSAEGIFLVKGYNTSWRALKTELSQILGQRSYCLYLPKQLMLMTARLLEALTPWGQEPVLTRFSVNVLSTDTLFDDSRIRELGFQPRYSLRDSILGFLEGTRT